jgi:hypothetical protein
MHHIPTQDREHCLGCHTPYLLERVYEERAAAGHSQGMFLPELVLKDRWPEIWALDLLAEEGFEYQRPLSLRWADEYGVWVDRRCKGFVMDFYQPELGLRVEIDRGTHKQQAKDAHWDQRVWNAVGIQTYRVPAAQVRAERRLGRGARWFGELLHQLDPTDLQRTA